MQHVVANFSSHFQQMHVIKYIFLVKRYFCLNQLCPTAGCMRYRGRFCANQFRCQLQWKYSTYQWCTRDRNLRDQDRDSSKIPRLETSNLCKFLPKFFFECSHHF